MPGESSHWFRAKRYGWGWTPCTWQGWAVVAVFLALVAGGVVFLLPSRGHWFFAGYVAALTALLTAVCLAKGESPRWRWGK
ncbi:DUF4175 domain-containing protein [Ramlibacter sp. XY19]|uniref:hypothetical protein n=1 Tax=Ramlibacter paludis TaxID=2908000 RepID=UPI0023DCC22B|nr:hypothetical protein [Ramlibacter paludis]MCG2594334.1 DUF4175 domain-containing protein [Ramlibacter paludis]